MKQDKKGKAEKAAEKTGQAIGKVGKKGWGVVKGFGKGVKEGLESDKKKKKWLEIMKINVTLLF